MDLRAGDVDAKAIVGAGITSVLTAWELARSDVDVIVLEGHDSRAST